MKVLEKISSESKIEKAKPYWAKIYTLDPYCIYFFGPFASQEEAARKQSDSVRSLEADGKNIVATFQVVPVEADQTFDSCSMTHQEWLQSLMGDYLKIQVPTTPTDVQRLPVFS